MAFLLITALPADDAYIVLEHRKMWDRVGLSAKTQVPLWSGFRKPSKRASWSHGSTVKEGARVFRDTPTTLHPLRAS